jgi:hypothetical protein
MQLYMLGTGIDRALYVAVNKDDDSIHAERIRFDRAEAERLAGKGHRLALLDRAPPRASEKPEWWQCRLCSHHDLCHGRKFTREANCRTCAHSTPLPSGEWRCERWEAMIPVDGQRQGCSSHVVHPDLAPVEWSDVGSPRHAGYGNLINGEPDLPGAMTSAEIIAEWERGQ